MSRIIISLLCVLVAGSYSFAGVTPATTPGKGESFPPVVLPVPENRSDLAYLGVSGQGKLTVANIKADILIIEIYSMYCPYCQKEAPLVNELYRLIDQNPAVRDKIKIIGIGAGNTPFEIEFFRNQFNVPFPLFPDPSYEIHSSIGEVRTPYFFVLKMAPDGSNKIIYSNVGSIGDAAHFLKRVREEAGLLDN